MRICYSCRYDNPADVGTCLNCAAAFTRFCPGCSQPAGPGARFCSQCGERLPEAAARRDETLASLRALLPASLTQKTGGQVYRVAGERRDVTVVFVALDRATPPGPGRSSEDTYVFVDEARRLAVDAIHKHEGTLDNFGGDSLMALFGAPVTHENDPERAVRAALEIQTALQPLCENLLRQQGVEFHVRIGINTGPVVAGKVGNDLHMEYTVIGDTVNLAARLQAAAQPGTILVSDETYQRTRPLFHYRPLHALAVPGLPGPIQAAQPLAVLPGPGRRRGLEGMYAAMIGRQADLARLQRALEAVQQRGQSRVVVITGEAGLGKSRLAAEFRAALGRAAAAPARPRVYTASCPAYARSRPMWTVAELLRTVLRVAETDAEAVQREALHGYLGYLGLAAEEVGPYLRYLLGLPQANPAVEVRLRLLDPATLQRQTHAALRQVLLAEAAQGATTLVFDDLHWVDPASQDFLQYLVQTTVDVPLLIVLISRDGEPNSPVAGLSMAASRQPERLVEIRLQPLAPDEAQLLISQMLGAPGAEAARLERRIADRAEGNPFYIEEILRMLIEQGGLRRAGEGWQVPAQAEAQLQVVPGTLRGLILARFDRLPERPRQRLQKAAVIGRAFPAKLLQLLEGEPEADAGSAAADLELLEARRFLAAEPFGAEPGYAFRHALVQEAVYGTLLKRDLPAVHEQIARAIEASQAWPPEEKIALLASHYAESRNPVRAVPYLLEAAEHAARRYANASAIQHYRQARLLLQAAAAHPAELARARLGLGKALKFTGQYSEAASVLDEAVQGIQGSAWQHEPTGLVLLTEGLRELADVRQREGGWDEAFGQLEAALAALGEDASRRHPRLWRSLMDRMAWVRFRQGRLEEAFELAQAATRGSDPDHGDDPLTLASLFNTLGGICWQQGNLEEATPYVRRSLELYERLGDWFGMANATTNLGILYYVRGLWQEAAENFERSDRLRGEIGYLPGRAANLQNLGLLRMALGDHTRAREHLETSLAISQQLGEDYDIVKAHIGLGQLALAQGRLDEAERHIQTALAQRETTAEDEWVQAGWCWALIQAERGDLPAGLRSAAEALRTAREAGLSESEADALRVLGALHERAGQWREAEERLRQSAALSQDHGDRYRQGLAVLELGQLYQRWREAGGDAASGSDKQALALAAFRQASELFEALGASYDLQLARAGLAQLETEIGPEPAEARLGSAEAASGPGGEWHPAAIVWVSLDAPASADAEQVFAGLAAVLPGLMAAAAKHDGHVIRRASGLTITFGAPAAHEDDAVRAVQTAWEISQVLAEAGNASEAAWTGRLAVTWGSVAAGYVSAAATEEGDAVRREFMVTGEPLQLAQAMIDDVPAGKVWASAAIRNATGHLFTFRPVSDHDDPGTWELQGRREQPGPARGLPGVRLQLIGRETPLEAMTALAQNLALGRGGLIWIEGEAGIGKSRLMHEFSACPAAAGAAVWLGQCIPQPAGRAFSLVTSLLRRHFNLHSADTPAATQARLDEVLAHWPAEAAQARPYLELLVGLRPSGPEGERVAGLEPDPLRQQIYVALRTVMKSLAAEQPLILLLDDLHWIDPISADLLVFLSNLIAEAPVLLVCALRWDETETTDDRAVKVQGLMRPDQVLRLHLDRLPEAEADRLLRELLGDDELPADLREFVLKRTEGNPFYIEEVVRTLIDHGYLRQQAGRWKIDPSVSLVGLPLPASLGALIQARVDALPPDLKHLLQCAAVIGGAFEESLLGAVAEMPQVAAGITRLEARGMLRRTAKMHEWQFNHTLSESAVYNMLFRARRQALHRRVAEALERRWGSGAESHAAELAYHFAQAGPSEKALLYLTLAGEQAARRYANEEALAYFQQAEQLLAAQPEPSVELRWRVAAGLGDVYRFVGELGASQAALEAGLALAGQAAFGPVHRAGLLRRLGETAQKQGEFEASLRHFDLALSQLAEGEAGWPASAEAHAEAARALAGLALTHMRQGRLEQARLTCEAGAARASLAGSLGDLAAVENLLGGIYYQLSAWDQALAHTRRAMALREQMGHTGGVAATSSNLAILAIMAGDWNQARASFERSLALRQELGDAEGIAIAHNNLGTLARDQGDLAAAEEHFQQSLEIATPLKMAYHHANACTNLADVLLLRGRLEPAEAMLATSWTLAEAIGAQDLLSENQRIRASLALARGAADEGRAAAQQAARLAAELGDRSLESAGWRVLAEIELAQGDAGAAGAAIERARRAINGVTSQLEAARVAAQAGRVSLACGAVDEARGHFAAAQAVFARLGARLDQARLEGWLASTAS